MASAPAPPAATATAAPSFASTKETTNYARLCRLLVDVGTHVLRETFDRFHPPRALPEVLVSPPIFAVLQSLRKKRVLNPSQWGKLFPAVKSSVSSKEFDITLLMVLLRNICNLTPPAAGWDCLPAATDTSLEAYIARIKYYRNTVYGHANEASVDDMTYAAYWRDIKDTLEKLGGQHYKYAIDCLKTETIDPEYEEHYQDLLKQWVKDEENIKDKLDEIAETLGRKLQAVKDSVEENIAEKLHHMESEIRTVSEKLHVLDEPKEEKDEEKTTEKFQQVESQLKSFGEKLDALMAPKEGMKDEENKVEKLEQLENVIQSVKEKLDTMAADQSRAPLALNSGQYATGSISRVQDHEIAVDNASPANAMFSGVGTVHVGAINIVKGNATFVQNVGQGQVIETVEQDY